MLNTQRLYPPSSRNCFIPLLFGFAVSGIARSGEDIGDHRHLCRRLFGPRLRLPVAHEGADFLLSFRPEAARARAVLPAQLIDQSPVPQSFATEGAFGHAVLGEERFDLG